MFPGSVAVDARTQEVYVVDTGNRRIQVLDREGRPLREFDSDAKRSFSELAGIAVRDDRIVVTDVAQDKVFLLTKRGEVVQAIGGFGSNAGEFDTPMSATMDKAGNVYVLDTYNNRVQTFDRDGKYLRSWGGWGSHAGFLASPSSIVERDGHIFVADLINHRIQVFDLDGTFVYQWGRHPAVAHEGQGRLHYPQALAINADATTAAVCEPFEYRCQVFNIRAEQERIVGVDDSAWWDKATRFHYGTKVRARATLLAIAEPDTHSVLVFDNTTDEPKLITKLGGQGREPGRFVRPSGMEIDDASGTIVVSDGGNHRLQVFQLQRTVGGRGYLPNVASLVKTVSLLNIAPHDSRSLLPDSPVEPSAIVRAKDGLYYVADPHNARVLVLDKDFRLTRVIGSYGTAPGQLLVPSNLEFSPDHEILYVVDTYNFRIEAFNRAGDYLFGWGAPGIGEGQFMHAFGVGVDREGNVYIGDDGANRIQKFSPKGVFLKKWGRWGTEPGQFYKPKGVTVDPKGHLIVANFGNHRGEVMTLNGEFISMFGIADGYVRPIAAESSQTDRLTNAGTYLVTYRALPNGVTLNEPFDLQVQIVDSKFRDPAPSDITMTISANMPEHDHGMTVRPRLERSGAGVWVAKGLLLHMPGYWRISIDLTRGNVTERADFDVNLKPE